MTNIIKAYAAFQPGGKLKPFEYNAGELPPEDVEIKIESCGICHSDLSMINNNWGMTAYPIVPGHEVIGTICQVGERVSHLKIGDLVGLGWHSGYCNICPSCLSGHHNLCLSSQPTIVNHYGGFAEKVRAQATSVVKLPNEMNTDTSGPLLCGGITVFNPLLQFDIKPTDKVGVIGIGGLGHMALQFYNAWGCEVTAFTSNAAKKAEALKLGAHYSIDSSNTAELNSFAGKFDLLISTVNVKLDWNAYLNILGPQGRFHYVGATLEPLDLSVFPLIMGQRTISGSPVGSPSSISKMLDFSVRHNIIPQVEFFDFLRINDAMSHLESGKARYRIVLKDFR